MTQTLQTGGLGTTEMTSHYPGGWLSKVKADSVSGETCFLCHGQRLLTVYSRSGREQGALWGPFIRTLIPFMRLRPHNLIASTGPASDTTEWRLGF